MLSRQLDVQRRHLICRYQLEVIHLEKVTEVMGMEDIKPIIWLKCIRPIIWLKYDGNLLFFYCLRHSSVLLPLLSQVTHLDTWNSVGQQNPVGKSDLAQSSHFSDEQTNLETEVAEMKLDPRTHECYLIQSLLCILRELLKAYIFCYPAVEKRLGYLVYLKLHRKKWTFFTVLLK